MSDLKTSILINRQVPEFVREEHPKFISFLEAYYEFLENKQGTEKNDLLKKSKDFRYLTDVDESLDEFEQQFFGSYLSLLPRDISVSKDFLIKNILPVYLSKGSESSFKLLFRILFGKEAEVSSPKNKILRASDGKWVVENSLRVTSEVFSIHTGNGTNKEFKLAQIAGISELRIFINDVLQSSGYYVKKELRELVFDSAPANSSQILVQYTNFDASILSNRKITGNTSGATAIVESGSKSTVSGEIYFDLFINSKTLDGSFLNGEFVRTNVILDDSTVELKLQTVSQLDTITVTKGGASYNIGDSVTVRGDSTRTAYAVVESIETGTIEEIDVLNGGAGFKINNIVYVPETSNATFNAFVQTVDTTATFTQNSVTVFTDLISSFANVTLNVASFGFPKNSAANIISVLSNTLGNTIISSIGPITSINVINSLITVNPIFEVTPETVNGAISLIDLGIIGRISVANAGTGYSVGEDIIFTNQPDDFWGRGAKARVSQVGANGEILRVQVTDGGLGYSPLSFPTVTANTANGGSNATLSVYCTLGDGESLQGVLPVDEDGNEVFPGQIKTIKILDPGAGYKVIPIIDLSKSGNGLAEATANLLNSYQSFNLGGRWTTSDSLLSSDDMRLQGRDYYINYSYVLSSKVEFSKYKEIFKQLIHPAGTIQYAEYRIDEEITSSVVTANSVSVTNTISGRVEVNSSIYVTGTNTKFLIANTRGLLVPGSNIAINSQVRTVNTIISNTTLTVTSAFTISTNNESLVILS